MHSIGLSPIYLVNRDADETAAIIKQFSNWDLRPLESVEAAKAALAEGDQRGVKLACGVGAIPSIEPVSEAEKLVYEISKTLFAHSYDVSSAPKQPEGFLPLPKKPVHLEMAYKVSSVLNGRRYYPTYQSVLLTPTNLSQPRMTLIRQIAEDRNWQTICGVEVCPPTRHVRSSLTMDFQVVLEGCFEQTYAWTGMVVDLETREAGRKILRHE